ncbi:DNA-binding transcriptional LysR family regulator [Paraburkholderia unamae]|uniref:DNA-binding transcriptional LysR family regulator n=2 Tax=Paraburkholderia unamae TaxID=219649 RepID=A0ABX5KRU0_9BURK|nr:LysR family transcriptional regulator [Paraburkholderia unamae]PVX82672.1 DNA-binding transcriptional LysR family regulator [Paraburkholderia unamae]RAR51351.1 DNA-binding transcriptional LysR family regulator [Paraburkholderia unamae]
MLNQLQAMRVFLKVAENNSFSRAAASLDLSNAAVTRYVALLEAHLNTRLINRTTRSLSLTEDGRAYVQGCRQMLELMDSIESSVGGGSGEPSGTLKLVASAAFSLVGLPPLVMDYCQRYPKVKLDLTLLHRNVDLVEDGFDIGILTSRQASSGSLVRRPLASLRPVVVASPAYLETYGVPAAPADLALCGFLAPSREIHGREWCFVNAQGEEESISVEPRCTVNDMIMLRQLALVHMGLAILPEAYVKDDLENRLLSLVLRDYEIREGDKELALVYPGRRHVSAKVRTFVDLAVEHFQTAFGSARNT